ncbi:hypothetical protein [Gemmatimonas sp.]|jgi:hypothetical protein|uniref:hypothetical protein n=1 Tax=Gemmatimonas sp. TaxID=1962908 RepID=UPI0025BD2D95|nr:hypothetical protein [Gemmatimonas sp.]MCA2991063.1 hypothetical protein [Gemmatimonas sp.]
MTDWDKELAKIDKQLASISDDELLKSAQPVAPAKGAPARALPAGAPKAPALPAATVPGAGKPWLSWAKVLVAVGAAAGLMFWPWPARCGAPLIGFTAATGGVALLGLWSALGTWRHRLGLAHVASLLVTAWGLALGAREVLPRVGYAVPTAERPGQWSCDGLPAMPGNPVVTPGADGSTSPGPASPAPAGLLPAGRGGTTL